MLPRELFELLVEYANCNPKEVVETVSDLLKTIREDSDKYIMELDNLLEEFAEDNDICSVCGNELEFVKDSIAEEYQGSPIGQRICSNGCY